MFNPWAFGLLCLTLVTLALTWRVPRAWLWIGVGAACFVATSLYLDFGGDRKMHPILSLACDALVCILIFRLYQEDWELGVFLAFMISVFVGVLRLGGFIASPIVYASLIELCNAFALLWVGGVGLIDMVGKNEHSRLHSFRGHIRHARHSL